MEVAGAEVVSGCTARAHAGRGESGGERGGECALAFVFNIVTTPLVASPCALAHGDALGSREKHGA